MGTGLALLLAAIIVLVLAIVASYVWYNFTEWTEFSYNTGDDPSWTANNNADISRLRFKDCIFTVTRADGKVATLNVSPVLNSMAVAYKSGSVGTNPPALVLTRPLNPFSFVIAGFNDKLTVSDPTGAPWCTAPPATCTKDSDCPQSISGSCVTKPPTPPTAVSTGICANCPGGAAVTLTGKVRTI